MAHKILFTEDALADLEIILDYIRADNPSAAERFGTSVLNHVELLQAFPGSACQSPSVRHREMLAQDLTKAIKGLHWQDFETLVDLVFRVAGDRTSKLVVAWHLGKRRVRERRKDRGLGDPDVGRASTSRVERKNGSLRQWCERVTRLTYAFSKKWENLQAALALHFAYYNLCRIHGSLRITPAMAAGLTDHVWSIGELVN